MLVQLTLKSHNSKTGKIPVSTTEKSSCPSSCAMFKDCYAKVGPLAIHWNKVSTGQRGTNWDEFCQAISNLPTNQIWRHNQAGDLPGKNSRINRRQLKKLVKANQGKKGFTYTHKQVEGNSQTAKKNRQAIKQANKNGFAINLSGNNINHADKLVNLNVGPVVVVVKIGSPNKIITPEGNTIIKCPAQVNEKINCENCHLCAIPSRKSIIGFEAHGASKNRLSILVG